MFGLQAWTVDFEMADSTDKLLGNCQQAQQAPGHNLNGPRVVASNSKSHAPHASNTSHAPHAPNGGSSLGGCCPSPEDTKCPLSVMDPDSSLADEIVRLNVGGSLFMTTRSTLDHVPNTRLYHIQDTDSNFNPGTGEWFFDRNPTIFNFILDFYRTDELHFPHNFCGPSIKKELDYWGIDECDISACCWNRYREYDVEKKIFERIERAFESKTLNEYTANVVAADEPSPSKWDVWKRRVYIFLEEPMSSKAAKVWTITFLLVVLGSIGVLCLETLPQLRVCKEYCPFNATTTSSWSYDNVSANFMYSNVTTQSGPTAPLDPGCNDHHINTCGFSCKMVGEHETNCKLRQLYDTDPHPALENIDSFCTCFFTVEFLARFIAAPNRLRFCTNLMNLIDVLCVLPMWIRYIMVSNQVQITSALIPVYFIIMMLRVLRICRVLRLARHYTGVKILLLALRASVRELGMLLIFVFIVVLIFAVVIYYAEFFVIDTFSSIPTGYWWAIITLTTVGYGDEYPKSVSGYIVGAMCALTGILATGLPVPIIANNFNLYYSHAKLKDAVLNRKPAVDHGRRFSKDSIKAIEAGDGKEDIVMKEATV